MQWRPTSCTAQKYKMTSYHTHYKIVCRSGHLHTCTRGLASIMELPKTIMMYGNLACIAIRSKIQMLTA